ncbi:MULTISPECIES: TetR/AcrR family transcriptional regulator [unclassified Paenibacillus]|uniref:TetR/AcrR family transcriptional regulator n=1 Tax=unclassified Paenibacillus TaxID=185978 RepID=UPI002405AD95|nr:MULTISPECIES: TetR/AcrR family transcriptional regulator [unclassified Paenibacillus]MDF9844081.1 AcrR family transcriptional regulator [Paenibacillus sp. PastF-2]MDF9850686.1 AcrR family transcriptional regulator [Paenibacillus sp. PastM-2]MDF9858592.1 AcrR family transcriptional regulator [Paenibacillus sp. PastF-1]MDH6483865.1 AcrR family transcriptional regulator [Paenibacillus sp. PastH-2]MDH6509861.1 AcrR family transcriptional regulator [Paenibacillus sp. PastM-3]
MTKESSGQHDKEQWIEELLAVKEDGQMTPKQISILEAAIEIFSDKGFSAASTSEIAQKAGVAEGTIFRYYKTKKDLLLSIVGPTMSRMIAPFVMRNFNGVLDMPFESYEAFLRAFIVNRLDFARKNFKIIRILVQEIPFQPALREQFAENVLAQVLERVTAITEHFQAEGEVIDAPTPAIIRFTISSVIGYLLARLLLMPEKDWDDEEEISLLISFMLHGIGGPALREQ